MTSGVLSRIRHGRGSGREGGKDGTFKGRMAGWEYPGLLDKIRLCFMLGNLVYIYIPYAYL